MPHFELLTIGGNYNIGLIARATDKFCLTGPPGLPPIATDILKVDTLSTTLLSIRYTGMFSACNSSGIIIPSIAEKEEIENLKSLGINVLSLDIKETALGNLILVNDKGCVISNSLNVDKKAIEDCFGCEVISGTIAGLDLVGSCGVATNKGLLVHRDCSEPELEKIEGVLKVKGDIGTANFGSPFVGAFIVANSNGFLVSERTTGPEMARIDEALGFI